MTSDNMPPTYNRAFGGYFSFAPAQYFTLDLPAIESNLSDYSVMFCGVNGAVSAPEENIEGK